MILIIEDNALEAQLLGITLRQRGLSNGQPFTCAMAQTGRQALDWLSHQPHESVVMIILDRHLKQREDGLALIPELRAAPALAGAAAIIVRSIADDPHSIEAARQANADAFISKSRRIPAARLLELLEQLWQHPQSTPRAWIAITG